MCLPLGEVGLEIEDGFQKTVEEKHYLNSETYNPITLYGITPSPGLFS